MLLVMGSWTLLDAKIADTLAIKLETVEDACNFEVHIFYLMS